MKKCLIICLSVLLIFSVSGCSLMGTLYQNGKKCFENGEYENAAGYFAAAIEKNPNRADYYIDYGLTLIKLDKYEEALQEFDKAFVNKDIIIVNRNNKRIYRGKGIAYYYSGEYQKAIDEFDKALGIDALSDLDQDILYYTGNAQLLSSKYEEAAGTYRELISMDKKSASSYGSLALCYRRMGDYENSLVDYDTAIMLDPEQYTYYFGKYYLLKEKGDETEAQEILKKASEINAVTKEAQYNLAQLHFLQGDYDTALMEFDEGYANGFKEAYFYIGEIYRIKKDYQKAVYYYRTYQEEGGNASPIIDNQIAACLIKTGEYDSALQYLKQGLAFQYADSLQVLKQNEIIVYESMGDFDEAKKLLQEYLSLYPTDERAQEEAAFIDTRTMEAVIPTAQE